MIKGLYWNIRGVGTSLRRLRRLIRLHQFSFIALFEPFLSGDRLALVQSQLGYPEVLSAPTNNIFIFYRSGYCVSMDSHTDQLIHVRVSDVHGSLLCFLTFVYAKCSRVERHVLWESLVRLRASLSDRHIPWLVGGDFNVIADLSEYSGRSVPDMGAIMDFQSCISDCGLLELPTTGGQFTWSGVRSTGRVWKRLDRILINQAWLELHPNSSVDILPRVTSDHAPMLLKISSRRFPGLFVFKTSGCAGPICWGWSALAGKNLLASMAC